MAVANRTIIKKMIDELEKAKAYKGNQKKMKQHIAHVRLLCDLILEDEGNNESSVDSTSISKQEAKAMLGDQYHVQNKEKKHKKSAINYEDENVDSIFDF